MRQKGGIKMTIEFPTAKDVTLRDTISKASEDVIDKEIKRMSKKLNNRIARAKQSGLDKYNPKAFEIITKFFKDTGLGTESGNFSSSTPNLTKKEKASYLVKMFHFETYQLNVSQLKSIREKNRETIKQETGKVLDDEQMDRIGELMRDVYRAAGDAGAIFREIYNSQDARAWATLHRNLTEEDVDELLEKIEENYGGQNRSKIPMQDVKDFIDTFKSEESNEVEYGGVIFDKLTGHPKNEITGELITDYTIDATSEMLINSQDEIANVDKYTGQPVPIKEFLEFIYGSITKQ